MISRTLDIDALLSGSIDMHVHPGPDTWPTRIDAVEAARQAQQAGMKAIVIKNHYYPTVPLATVVARLVPGIQVLGSISLDFEIGGINVRALENAASMGARVVWMPTFSAANSRSKMRELGISLRGEGFSILDSREQLLPEIDEVLKIIRQYDLVLATGHLSPLETFKLVEKAAKVGVWKLVITHPLGREFFLQPMTKGELERLAKIGAFIELTFIGFLPTEFRHDPSLTVEVIRAVGADHCIISTDLGQYYNPPPVEGMRMFIATLLKYGVTESEIEVMAKTNPSKLLGLTG
jgi:hypothetical protein